jgi:dCMP deaminase
VDFVESLRLCYGLAENSGDHSTKNAAMIVNFKTGELIGFGINDIPKGVNPLGRRERPMKYQFTEHAERAAIFNAAKQGMCTDGATMFCCWAACADCARAIVLSGITRLVRHSVPVHDSRPDWDASIAVADQILTEAGVEIVTVREVVGARMFFNGEWIEV